MSPLISLAILYLLCLILFILIGILFIGLWSLFVSQAPFIPISTKILPKIIQTLKIKNQSIVYDLGCGDGRVLFACHKLYPQAQYFGFDNGLIPYLCAFIRLKKTKKPHNIIIARKNFFQENLSNATHLFVYLIPDLMDKLFPKLEKELSIGTRLISCDFCFSHKKPIETINLQRPKNALGKILYIYEF